MIHTQNNKLVGMPISTLFVNLAGTMTFSLTVLVRMVSLFSSFPSLGSSYGFGIKQEAYQIPELTAPHLYLTAIYLQNTNRGIYSIVACSHCGEVDNERDRAEESAGERQPRQVNTKRFAGEAG